MASRQQKYDILGDKNNMVYENNKKLHDNYYAPLTGISSDCRWGRWHRGSQNHVLMRDFKIYSCIPRALGGLTHRKSQTTGPAHAEKIGEVFEVGKHMVKVSISKLPKEA